MSADFRTGSYAAFGHLDADPPYLHVTAAEDDEFVVGNFTLAGLGELVRLAGQAWPEGPGVRVQYVIEARRKGDQPWASMWSARADESEEHPAGVSEGFARVTFQGMSRGRSPLLWRLVRRTVVASDEVLGGEGAGDAVG